MREAALRRLADYARRSESALEPLLYVREGGDAAEHLFEVAGGLDSLVPGEAQILAQIRESYQHAREMGSTGTVSNRLFHEALEAGKRVRHETAIGRSNASVASVAAELVRERLGDLGGARVLIVGAGKVAELVAQNLASRGGVEIVVANRSGERGAALAERFNGTSVPLDRLAEAVAEADVVVSSTVSDSYLIGPGDVPSGRRVLVDLALPRDIDPAVADDRRCHAGQHRRPRGDGAAQHRPAPGRGRAGVRDRGRAGQRVPQLAGRARGGAGDHAAAGAGRADPPRRAASAWTAAGSR